MDLLRSSTLEVLSRPLRGPMLPRLSQSIAKPIPWDIMLIVFGGLPGTGKTTLARELSRQLSAVYLRIDTLEQAIVRSGIASDAGPVGYVAGYALAADNLTLGMTVVADSVNALSLTRDAWIETAKLASTPFVEIELICSDKTEHRRRVETREPDITGHTVPSWQEILNRRYEPWLRKHIVLDTAMVSISQAVIELRRQLAAVPEHPA
jgi:predicted kinase